MSSTLYLLCELSTFKIHKDIFILYYEGILCILYSFISKAHIGTSSKSDRNSRIIQTNEIIHEIQRTLT